MANADLALLQKLTAHHCFGQPAHRLVKKPGKATSFRGHVPATDEEKQAGRQIANAIEASLALEHLKFSELAESHRRYLHERKRTCMQYGSEYAKRLRELEESEKMRLQLPVYRPTRWSLPDAPGHFVSTGRAGQHGEVQAMPVRPREGIFKVGALARNTEMSKKVQMLFSSSAENVGAQKVMLQSPEILLDDKHGATLQDEKGVVYSSRVPRACALSEKQCAQGRSLIDRLYAVSKDIKRGRGRVAMTACLPGRDAGFVGCEPSPPRTQCPIAPPTSWLAFCSLGLALLYAAGGGTRDQNTQLYMTYSMCSHSTTDQIRYLNLQNELRAFMKTHVMPTVYKYFFAALDTPVDAMREAFTEALFVSYLSQITIGSSLFNMCHEDEDLWVTILVAFGDCEHGGDFIHPTIGLGHKIMAGDILLVNPRKVRAKPTPCAHAPAHAPTHAHAHAHAHARCIAHPSSSMARTRRSTATWWRSL